MEVLSFAASCIWDGVSQFPRMLRAVHWHQTWGIVVSWLWKRLSVHWAWGSSFKHELPGNPRVSGCLNRTVGKVITGGFNLDKGRLSCCYREISNQTVPSCPLMLFQAHNKAKRELEETWQNEEDTVVEQKHSGIEKLLPLCEANLHKAAHAPFTIAITQPGVLSCFCEHMTESIRYHWFFFMHSQYSSPK